MTGLYNVKRKKKGGNDMKVFAADIAANLVVIIAIAAAVASFY
jgi:hypothetical protein